MLRYDFTSTRLYVDTALAAGIPVNLSGQQTGYLLNVLRHKPGDSLLLFNGRDGEWLAKLEFDNRQRVCLTPQRQTRPQGKPGQLIYLFALLKKTRLDYMVQKAVEMGVSNLQPVITDFTRSTKFNLARINDNIVEAAQQCGVLSLPICKKPEKLQAVLNNWPTKTRLIYCDEASTGTSPLKPLQQLKSAEPIAVLVGPEGGFSQSERQLLQSLPFVTSIALGPRILRADTAAIAVLALVQASLGDWN